MVQPIQEAGFQILQGRQFRHAAIKNKGSPGQLNAEGPRPVGQADLYRVFRAGPFHI
jgi:hypothetical protein